MRTFLAPIVLVFVGLALWATLENDADDAPSSAWAAWTLLLGAPASAAWIATECMQFVFPSRLLDPRVRAPVRRLAAGVVAGLLGAAAGATGVIFLTISAGAYRASSNPLLDAAILGGGSALGVVMVLTVMPRVRPGRCVHCGYDLAAMTPRAGGRCAECGADVMAV